MIIPVTTTFNVTALRTQHDTLAVKLKKSESEILDLREKLSTTEATRASLSTELTAAQGKTAMHEQKVLE